MHTERPAEWSATGLEIRGHREVRGSIPRRSAKDGWPRGKAPACYAGEPARVRRFDPSTIRHMSARSPTGRRRRPEMANSAGSNPAARTNATVAQQVGGSGFKPRAVSVRTGPVAPARLAQRVGVPSDGDTFVGSAHPKAEARHLKRRQVAVRIRGRAPGAPFSPDGCNPPGFETGEGRREVRVLGSPPNSSWPLECGYTPALRARWR
jgi:hypothetical protein